MLPGLTARPLSSSSSNPVPSISSRSGHVVPGWLWRSGPCAALGSICGRSRSSSGIGPSPAGRPASRAGAGSSDHLRRLRRQPPSGPASLSPVCRGRHPPPTLRQGTRVVAKVLRTVAPAQSMKLKPDRSSTTRLGWDGLGLVLPGGWGLGGPGAWGAGGCDAVLPLACGPGGHLPGAAVPLEPLVARGCGSPAMECGQTGWGEGWRLRCPAAGWSRRLPAHTSWLASGRNDRIGQRGL
jgi:hypothetical protein